MSELSYLEKLLDGVEVKWLPLGELGELVRGNGLPKSDFTESGVPAIHYGQIYTFYGLSTETTKSFVSQETAKKLKKVNSGDVVITNTSENFTDVGKTLVYLGKEQAVTGGHATIFKPNSTIIGKYFAYFTQTDSFANEKRKYSKGTKVIDVSASDMAKITIPIPCPNNPEKSLAIQSEIVRILDKFTALTAELTAELNMRKKQYNYYRDRLFSFGAHDVKRLKLGELCVIGDGLHGTPEYDANGDYFFINGNNLGYQKISFNDNTKKVNDSMFKKHGIHFDPINTVFLSINGTIGNVSFYNNEKIVLGKSVAYFKIKSPELHTRYLFYFLQTNYAKQYFENQKTGSTIKNLGLKSLRAFEIPIPSVDEQLYIVATMDKFYNMTNSITEGLPREIELRQKQYEYYRDLLFSFPKPETVSN
ncbi:TPA: restriction endonuclease subunit S [Escherichia coli]|nr:restriction endonuclease subunit S [Escherichia coli]